LGAIPAAALDPNITTLGEIPQPPLMGNVDPSKIDEIRRTVYVGNLNSQVIKKKLGGGSCLFF
jgi:arginine/serine-rich splicing factor 12